MKSPIFLQKPTPDHCGPGRVGKSKYLETKNLLSEFDTEEKRLTVLRNLGILNSQIDIVQELGDDTSVVMSQKAVTDAINNNKNVEIYESENNLPTSAETGRIAAVVYQTNNETVNRLYFKNEESWKSINDVKIVDAENKLDPSAPQGTISVVAINKQQKFLSDLNCPRELKTAEDFEQLEFIEEPLVINAPVHVDIDLSEELITLTFAQDFYIPKQTNSTDILPNLPHYIYIGKFDTLTSDEAAWGIYHFSQTLGGGIIAEYDSNGDRISYNEMQIQDLNLYLKYQYRYKYWISKKTIPNYDIVNTFIAVGQTVMTTVPYIKDFDKWTSLLNTDILYIDEAKLAEHEMEQDGTTFLVRVPKDRLKEITRGVDFIDFKNYSRICVGNNIYPLFLEDGMYTTPIRTILEEDYALQIWPMVISGFSDSYTFQSGYVETELAGITIAKTYTDLSSDEKVGSIATVQDSVDEINTVSEFYKQIQGNFPTQLGEVIIDPKEHTDVRVEGYHHLDMYIYNLSIDGRPISQASFQGRLIISEFNTEYSSENAVWGIYYNRSQIDQQENAILEYDQNGNRITWNPDTLTAFNNSKTVTNTGGKVYGGYISTFDPYLSVLDGIMYFSASELKTTLYLKHDFSGWEKYYSPIKNSSIKLEHLSSEVTKTLKGINIYDSENSLPVNSEAGNIATVSNINIEEIEVEDKFSVMDIYIEENPDCEPLMELKITVPETEPTEACEFVFGPKGYNNIEELVQGRYLGLMLEEGALVTIVFENGLPIINMSPLATDSSIIEETLTQVNEIISSWGGVVCYGVPVEGSAPAVTAPTEAQIEAIDLFIGYNNGTHIETIETHVNDIYFKETTGWRKINDIKIVDSIDKLDKNAPQGSLASVAVNTLGEISFSELYQPTEEDIDLDIPPIHKYSRVNGISVIAPDPSINPPEFEINLFSEDFNPENNIGSVIGLVFDGYAELYNIADSSQNVEFNLLIYNEEENTLTINEENLTELNNILSEKNYFYGGTYGPTNEDGDWGTDPSISDYIYRAISGVQKTDLYIKDTEGWKSFADEELKNQISDLEVNLTNLENTVNNLEDKTTLIVNSVDELDPDAPTGTLANVVYGDQPIIKPISEQGIKQIIFGDFVGESFIIPENNYQITFRYSSLLDMTSLSVSYSPDTSTVDLYCTVYMTRSKLCSYKIDTKEITELNQQLIDAINIKLKNGNLSGSIYVPSNVNEEACYKFFDQFIKNQAGYIPGTVYSYTKYESGWEQYDKILKSRNIFNSPNDLDSNSELGYVCSVVETSDEPRYLLLDNGPVGTLEFGYFNGGEFIDLPADIINLEISERYSVEGSSPDYAHKLSVTKDLTTNRIIFEFKHYLTAQKSIFEFDVSTLSFIQPIVSTPFAIGNCNFSTSESNLEFLWQFFVQKIYPKVTKLYTKNETGWEQYNEIINQSVTAEKLAYQSVITEKVADEAIVFDKLSSNVQKILTFVMQHFNFVFFKDAQIETICTTNWDTNGDGFLTKEEISAVTDIGEVFKNNKEIVSFDELSNFTNLTSIPERAFEGCYNLTSINLPESVTSIGQRAFSNCSFKSINIPNSVTNIGDYAFQQCDNLKSINIPDGVTSIRNNTFYFCTSLTSINIPDSVTNIGSYAFYYCGSLTSVRSYATTPPTLGSSAFTYTPTTMTIYVPDASVDAYKAAWSSYASQIKPMSEYVES